MNSITGEQARDILFDKQWNRYTEQESIERYKNTCDARKKRIGKSNGLIEELVNNALCEKGYK